jgi:hypothetical protein
MQKKARNIQTSKWAYDMIYAKRRKGKVQINENRVIILSKVRQNSPPKFFSFSEIFHF